MIFKLIIKRKIIMKIDNKGQISVELLLLISFALISAILLANAVIDTNELNVVMASARNGAFEGISSNGLAIYPKESYENYSKDVGRHTDDHCLHTGRSTGFP